jgi:hypothetical protein
MVVAVIPEMVLKHRKHLIAQFLIEPRCLEIVGVEEHVSACVRRVSIVKGPMAMDDAPPRDCVPSLLRVLCCHIPCPGAGDGSLWELSPLHPQVPTGAAVGVRAQGRE